MQRSTRTQRQRLLRLAFTAGALAIVMIAGVPFASAGLTPAPVTVYVDDNWSSGDIAVRTDCDGGAGELNSTPRTAWDVDAFNDIYNAVQAVDVAGTVLICPGTYSATNDRPGGGFEEYGIIVEKAVTIQGAGRSRTIVASPGTNDGGDINYSDSSIPAVIRQGFTIAANGVTVRDLTIDGDALSVTNGLQHGITTCYSGAGCPAPFAGDWNNLAVQGSRVRDVERRGINVLGGTTHSLMSNILIDITNGDYGTGIRLYDTGAVVRSSTFTNVDRGVATGWSNPSQQGLVSVRNNTFNTPPNTGMTAIQAAGFGPGSFIRDNIINLNTNTYSGSDPTYNDRAIEVSYALDGTTGMVSVHSNTINLNEADAGILLYHNESSPVQVYTNTINGMAPNVGTGILVTDNGDFFDDEDGISNANVYSNTIDGHANGIHVARTGTAPAPGRPVNLTLNANTITDSGFGLWIEGMAAVSSTNDIISNTSGGVILVGDTNPALTVARPVFNGTQISGLIDHIGLTGTRGVDARTAVFAGRTAQQYLTDGDLLDLEALIVHQPDNAALGLVQLVNSYFTASPSALNFGDIITFDPLPAALPIMITNTSYTSFDWELLDRPSGAATGVFDWLNCDAVTGTLAAGASTTVNCQPLTTASQSHIGEILRVVVANTQYAEILPPVEVTVRYTVLDVNSLIFTDVVVPGLDNTGLEVSEGALAGDRTALRLSRQPLANVTVDLSSANPAQLRFLNPALLPGTAVPVNTATLTFTPANWNQNQFVYLTAPEDSTVESSTLYSLTFTVGSTDPGFDGFQTSRSGRVYDAGVNISPLDPTTIDEGVANDGSYTMVLNGPPGLSVYPNGGVIPEVVYVRPRNNGLALPTPVGNLPFTRQDWNTPKMVLITAPEDSVVRPSAYSVVIPHTISSNISPTVDSRYGGPGPNVSVASLTVLVNDNDGGPLTVDGQPFAILNTPADWLDVAPTGLTVSEGGAAVQVFAVRLADAAMPDAPVVIDVSASGQFAQVSPAQLTFTESNWQQYQVVSVIALDDVTAEAAHLGDLRFAVNPTLTADGSFPVVALPGIVIINDNDALALDVVSAPNALVENAAAAAFAVRLSAPPPVNETVVVGVGYDTAASVVSPAQLVFTAANWNVYQFVTVQAAATVDGVRRLPFSFSIVSGTSNPAFLGIGTQAGVIITDAVIDTGVPVEPELLPAQGDDGLLPGAPSEGGEG